MTSSRPQQPIWYDSPKEVQIKFVNCQAAPFFEEYAVEIQINGETASAMVPVRAIDLEHNTIAAFQVGELQEDVFLILPSSSMGRTTLKVHKSKIEEIVIAG